MIRRAELDLAAATPLPPRVAPVMPARSRGARPELGDLALTGAILLVALLPLALHLAGVGHWSGGALGLGAALATFAALQLLDHGRSARRVRSRLRHAPRRRDRGTPRIKTASMPR